MVCDVFSSSSRSLFWRPHGPAMEVTVDVVMCIEFRDSARYNLIRENFITNKLRISCVKIFYFNNFTPLSCSKHEGI